MKKITRLLFGALFLGLIIWAYGWFKPHRDPSTEKAIKQLNAVEIQEQFKNDLRQANAIYLDKVVLISGAVSEIEDSLLILDNGVLVKFKDRMGSYSIEEHLNVKGRVVGYDELFEQVRLDFAVIQ